MSKFKLLNGSYRGQDGTRYKEGDSVTTDSPLDEQFKRKFEKVEGRRGNSAPDTEKAETPPPPDKKFEVVPDGKRFNVIRVVDGMKINDKTLTKLQAEKLAGVQVEQVINLAEHFWTAPRIWPDQTVFIIGGGPSLQDFDWNLIKQYRCIGCNDAYQLGDWVDVCCFGDAPWYHIHYKEKLDSQDRGIIPGLESFNGLIVTCHPEFHDNSNVRCMLRKPRGFSVRPFEVAWNCNTGSASINLAYHLGAKRAVLLGFDMGFDKDNKSNWHYNIKDPEQIKTNPHVFEKFQDWLPYMEKERQAKVGDTFKILNATPNSALEVFPKVKLEDVLAEEKVA